MPKAANPFRNITYVFCSNDSLSPNPLAIAAELHSSRVVTDRIHKATPRPIPGLATGKLLNEGAEVPRITQQVVKHTMPASTFDETI